MSDTLPRFRYASRRVGGLILAGYALRHTLSCFDPFLRLYAYFFHI